MTRCPSSPPKKRHSCTGKGSPGNYKHGMRGHSWKKLFNSTDVHVGRKCTRCPKIVPNGKVDKEGYVI